MTVIQFPVFVEGQTLTDDDLNELRDALDQIDRRIGRAIGFGIDCGLGGAIQADQLVVEKGLAIDQLGQVLDLDAPFTTKFPPTTSADPPPGFLETAPGGFTPVLTLTSTEVPAEHCNEAGCEGHAKQRKLTTAVSVFPGRLKGAVVDFGDEKLLALEPLLVRKTGAIGGAFVGLRDAIVKRMGDRLDGPAKKKLAGMTIDGDLPAIQGFKAGFLNQVFFAALDLLRCELEAKGTCITAADGVGVALGWLHPTGTTWAWDCRYRHDWDVPSGVALALIGGRCVDPCDLYRDELNALINTFEVPVTPAPPDPPDSGGVVICYERPQILANGQKVIRNVCDNMVVSDSIHDKWRDYYFRERVQIPPISSLLRAEILYGLPGTDWAEAGKLSLLDAVGKHSDNVVKALAPVLEDKGNKAGVQVLTQNQASKLDGFQPGTTLSAADTVVLVEDAQHKVIGVGSIPANTTVRGAVAEVPRVAGLAEGADKTAKSALDSTVTLANRLTTVDTKIGGFSTFQTNLVAWQSTIDGRMSGLANEIDAKALAAVGKFQLAVQGEIDQRIGAAFNTAKAGFMDQVRAEMQAIGTSVKNDVAKDMQAANLSLRKDVESDQKVLSGKFEILGQQVAGFSGQVEVATQQSERSNMRIDEVLVKTRLGAVDLGGVRDVVDRNLVAVLDNMRTSIVAAATPAQRAKVNAALAESEDAFKSITEASAAGPVAMETQREAINTVLSSMTSAVEAAGAPASDVERLRRDLGGLTHR